MLVPALLDQDPCLFLGHGVLSLDLVLYLVLDCLFLGLRWDGQHPVIVLVLDQSASTLEAFLFVHELGVGHADSLGHV